MPRVEIADVPDDVYTELEARARQNGKSVGEQAADYLRQALAEEAAEARLLAEIRREREALNVWVTDADLGQAKHWGRE
ncbi:MAG TPA: hypothetical protein VER17_01955 [Tepidisphaeraceae bacterium]|nr:hypothetical protein [Tepidisphaeraceae bacterium]